MTGVKSLILIAWPLGWTKVADLASIKSIHYQSSLHGDQWLPLKIIKWHVFKSVNRILVAQAKQAKFVLVLYGLDTEKEIIFPLYTVK